MNRLEKKCFAASAGVHVLLVLILFVGPAFLSSSPPKDTMPILDFVPFKTVDAMVSGGGNPNARPMALPPDQPPKPLVQPPPPVPQPEPKPQPEPEPVKPVVQPKADPDTVEVETKKRRPEVNTTIVRRTDAKAEAAKKAARDAEARKAAEARRRLAGQILAGAERIANGVSSSTDIELKGPGGGGIPYANFLQAVQSRYDRAWIRPSEVAEGGAKTLVSVTIARDGTVLNARILRHSGSLAVDQSVQRTLDEVKWAAPLPDDAPENQRTVEITFDVSAKRTI